MSPNVAHSLARANRSDLSLLVSRGSNLTFSSIKTSPADAFATAAIAVGPLTTGTNVTDLCSNSPSRFAAGASEYFGSAIPLGLPK